MNLGVQIKKIRTTKGLSQKEVALRLGMDPAQYSRIENGKSDPYFSSVDKIAQALGVDLSELFQDEKLFKEVHSYDKSLLEKMGLIEELEEKEKQAFYSILDALVAKRKLKETLSNALNIAS